MLLPTNVLVNHGAHRLERVAVHVHADMGACVRAALAHMTADICRMRHDDSPAENREQKIGEATNRKISSRRRAHVFGWPVVRLCGTGAFVSPQEKEKKTVCTMYPSPSSERPCCLALHCARVERAAVPRRAHVILSIQYSVAYTANWLGQSTRRACYAGMEVWFAGSMPHWRDACHSRGRRSSSPKVGETSLRPGFPRR